MIRATLDLLTMKAFRPDIRDYRIPFRQREIKEPILGISIHRSGATLCCIQVDGNGDVQLRRFKQLEEIGDEELRAEVEEYSRRYYIRYGIGLLSYGFTVEHRSLQTEPGVNESELLRNDPATVIGADVEMGAHYSVIRQPNDPSHGLVFTYNRAAVSRLESLSQRSPLSFLQIGGGVEWALSNWLENSPNRQSSRPVDLVIHDAPTTTIVQMDDCDFSPNLFCRTDGTGVSVRESTIIRRGLERYLRSGSRVVLLDLSASLSESRKDGIGELLEDVIGGDDLLIEETAHPLQLLFQEEPS